MAHMRNYTRPLCFIALIAMAAAFFSGHAAGSYIDTFDDCTLVDYCSPPDRASGNIACKAYCAGRGYNKDHSSCVEGSSSSCCCSRN
ncbi:hypothetical protein ZWY2020_047605 [Hordeum vulgare]|nr:hypothetical protein ZWY2020_047604 [Hordeum vulgare]KAI4974325.1 hypothetical protein ZWY2020_047605 [Hordeum vulgare]